MEAVGIGASSRELRTPCFTTALRSFSQSQRPLVGVTPHMSNWKMPCEIGLSREGFVGFVAFAKSIEASMAPK